MDPHRKLFNDQHKLLRQALTDPSDHSTAMDLFLGQHAMVHDAQMSNSGLHSFADEVWQGASGAMIRCVPPKFEHSIAWLIWHIARIEDMTMNVLLAGRPQTFHQDDWFKKMNLSVRHSGNVAMDHADVVELSKTIHLDALKTYRLEVGRSTREAVSSLSPEAVAQKVDRVRLQGLLEDDSVAPEAADLIEYWGNLTVAGLLLMPPTRHCLVHLNEARRLKRKCL